MIKRGIGMLLAVVLLYAPLPLRAAQTLTIDSTYGYAADLHTLQVLYEKESDQRMYPASMTKVLTALTALDAIESLDDEVTITLEMLEGLEDGTYTLAGFLNGEVVTMRDLLYGTLLASGADACQAFAVSLFGSEEAMVEAMNAKAKALGMEDSHFTNTVGMHDEDHYTSARDLALLMAAAWDNEELRTAMSTREYATSSSYYHGEGIALYNSWDQQLSIAGIDDAYVLGGKTGYTPEAGYCFFGVCEIQGAEVIVVAAGASPDAGAGGSMSDVTAISSYIDEQMEPVELAQEQDELYTLDLRHTFHEPLTLRAPSVIRAWVPKGEDAQADLRSTVENDQAPVTSGDQLASAEVWIDDARVASLPLNAPISVDSDGFAVVLDTVRAIVWPYGVALVIAAGSGYGIYTLGRKWKQKTDSAR